MMISQVVGSINSPPGTISWSGIAASTVVVRVFGIMIAIIFPYPTAILRAD
jgi:hypothetical protein